MVRSKGDCVVFMDCWAEYERITAPTVEQVWGIFKTVAVKGMQVEVVLERHGQYNKAFDMQPQAGKEVSLAQQGSGAEVSIHRGKWWRENLPRRGTG